MQTLDSQPVVTLDGQKGLEMQQDYFSTAPDAKQDFDSYNIGFSKGLRPGITFQSRSKGRRSAVKMYAVPEGKESYFDEDELKNPKDNLKTSFDMAEKLVDKNYVMIDDYFDDELENKKDDSIITKSQA